MIRCALSLSLALYLQVIQNKVVKRWAAAGWLLEFLSLPLSPSLPPPLQTLTHSLVLSLSLSLQVIRSEVVQRWAAVGWLLKCAKTPTGAAGIKLALFYDWLFFATGACYISVCM